MYLTRQCKREVVYQVLSLEEICWTVTTLWMKVSVQWTQGGHNSSNSIFPFPFCHCLPGETELRHWKVILILMYGTSWYSRAFPMIYLQFYDQLSSVAISPCFVWQHLLFSIQTNSSVFEKGFWGNIKLMERTSFRIMSGQWWLISMDVKISYD